MKYEYYITNYLCQNISLLDHNYAYYEYWEKMAKIWAIPGRKGFKALPKLQRPLYIFGFLIRQFQNYRFKPCPTSMEQFLFHASDFRLFRKPWKVWTPPILKMILAAKQVKPFKVFEMFHCLSMYECHVFLPPPVTVLHRRAIP